MVYRKPTNIMEPNEKMAKFDYVVMIDKSGSMSETDCPGGKSRWDYAKEYAESIARQAEKFDSNGIDVILFSGTPKKFEGVTSAKVKEIFTENSPSGSTDTAAALKLVFDSYNAKKAAGTAKPMVVICVTDGAPTDINAVEKALIDHANSLNEDADTGVTFVQIGKDPQARAFLKHLDDNLQSKGAKFDIVDCKNEEEMENISITDLLEAAIAD